MAGESEDDKVRKALRAACAKVRSLLVDADRDEVVARHQAGEVLRAVKGAPDTYGRHAIEHISEELGIAPRLLYHYVAVAETWSGAHLRAVLARTNRFGHVLSWSHFVALARVRDARVRKELLDECLREGWTVRDLIVAIDRATEGVRASDAATDGEEIRVALRESILTGSRAVADLRTLGEALADRLGELEEPVDEGLLARAVETFEELTAHVGATLAQLKGARESQSRVRVAGGRMASTPAGHEEELVPGMVRALRGRPR